MAAPGTAEIAYALDGAWRLACRDPAGLGRFAGTAQSFWRSFWAAVLAAPLFVLLLALRDLPDEPRGGMGVLLAAEGIAYVANWAAFPLAMVYVARLLRRERRYFLTIEAYNWSAVIQVALFAAATAIAALDFLPEALSQGIAFGITLLVLVYEWFVIRVGLAVGGWTAAGVVVLDLAIGVFLNGMAQSIYT
ncbi:MAG: hypothetical protein AB7P02_30535 [Alphaproteobacteria bacterium]